MAAAASIAQPSLSEIEDPPWPGSDPQATREPPHDPIPRDTTLSEADRYRIRIWFDFDQCASEVAQQLKTTLLDLARWSEQPHIAAALNSINRVVRMRSQAALADAQRNALSRLNAVINGSRNDEVARRAADRLLRPTIRRTIEHQEDTAPESRAAPAPPYAPSHPATSALATLRALGSRPQPNPSFASVPFVPPPSFLRTPRRTSNPSPACSLRLVAGAAPSPSRPP